MVLGKNWSLFTSWSLPSLCSLSYPSGALSPLSFKPESCTCGIQAEHQPQRDQQSSKSQHRLENPTICKRVLQEHSGIQGLLACWSEKFSSGGGWADSPSSLAWEVLRELDWRWSPPHPPAYRLVMLRQEAGGTQLLYGKGASSWVHVLQVTG